MTIDERLEALTQSVELLVGLHRDHENSFAARREANEKRMAELIDNNNRLSNIIIAHDSQLDEHERRLKDLDGK